VPRLDRFGLFSARNEALWFIMKNRPLKARRPVAGERVDRITLSIASEDKAALGKIADEKKVSIAWVIRDAITKYLSEEQKKSEA
jgi:hypothetical protein